MEVRSFGARPSALNAPAGIESVAMRQIRLRRKADLEVRAGLLGDLFSEELRGQASIDASDQLAEDETVGEDVIDDPPLAAEPMRLGGDARGRGRPAIDSALLRSRYWRIEARHAGLA